MTTVPRWCVNCKHSGYETSPVEGLGHGLMVCKHPLVNERYAEHLVSGEYRMASATRNDFTQCGLEGRLWESKHIDDSMRPRSGSDFKPTFWERLRLWRRKEPDEKRNVRS
jgi:hypothetical protein